MLKPPAQALLRLPLAVLLKNTPGIIFWMKLLHLSFVYRWILFLYPDSNPSTSIDPSIRLLHLSNVESLFISEDMPRVWLFYSEGRSHFYLLSPCANLYSQTISYCKCSRFSSNCICVIATKLSWNKIYLWMCQDGLQSNFGRCHAKQWRFYQIASLC